MTGTSQVIKKEKNFQIEIVCNSTNRGNFFCKVDLPQFLKKYESQIIAIAKKYIQKGNVEISIMVKKIPKQKTQSDSFANEFHNTVKTLSELIKQYPDNSIEQKVALNIALHLFSKQNALAEDKVFSESDETKIESILLPAVEDAIKKLDEKRKSEGNALEMEILKGISIIKYHIENISREFELEKEKIKAKFEDKIKQNQAAAEELLSYLKKTDISEEITRLKSHIEYLEKILKEENEPGKKGKFMINEILREASTTAAKSTSHVIQKSSVEIRAIAETIKEQLANVI